MDSIAPAAVSPRAERGVGWQLFALSFAGLFLELMLIRWVPAVVRLVAYYANLMLVSSFLGLGVGALLARRRGNWLRWFPLLLAADVSLLLGCQWVLLPTSKQEHRFFASSGSLLNYLILIGIFVCNVVLFVPIGNRVGRLFGQIPPLRAYMWDLGGSLCGSVCFGLFSLFYFSPMVGIGIVMAIYAVLADRRGRLLAAVAFPITLAIVFSATERRAIWSRYHYITIAEMQPDWPAAYDPPPNLRTMHDPPLYWVRVGRDFYQQHGSLELERYSPGLRRDWVQKMHDQYVAPYAVAPHHARVAVMGAGGGMDVHGALLAGAEHVDAVEIEPKLPEISRRMNASGVYDDPRVTLHIDDARAYLRNTPDRFDLIAFGYLDSQSLFSSMSSLRIDGYIYTVESMRQAWSRLNDQGMLSVAFYAVNPWMGSKLQSMIHEATGVEPIAYVNNGTLLLFAGKNGYRATPEQIGLFGRFQFDPQRYDVPTDDWPYLYLMAKKIPWDYAVVIGTLSLLSIVAVALIRGREASTGDVHFFSLGLGFLLLQTKSITDCSLYFGTTWLVTNVVICGVLLMVLAANLVAMHLPRPSRWFYLPLLAALTVLYFVHRDWVLGQSYEFRLAWALLVVPLPIFFAGILFSTTFRRAADPASSFGANLIGATIGGFCEYLSMATGNHALLLIVGGAYLLSLLFVGKLLRPAAVLN